MATGQAIKAGEAFIALSVRGVREAMRRIGRLGAMMARTGAAAVAALSSGIATFSTFAVRHFVKVGDEVDKMSKRLGTSTESLSQLGFAAEQSGASLGDIETGFRGMARSIRGLELGLQTSVRGFEELNLTFADLQGLTPEEQFTLIADRLSQIEDPTKRAGVAMEVFGRAGTRLLPLLEGGAEGIANLREQADLLGRTITEEQAKSAAELADAWNRAKSAFLGFATEVGAALAPQLKKMLDQMTRFLVDWKIWVAELELVFQEAMSGLLIGIDRLLDPATTTGNRLLRFLEQVSGVPLRFARAPAGDQALAAPNLRRAEELRKLLRELRADRPSERLPELLGEIGESVQKAIQQAVAGGTVGVATIGAFGARAEQLGVRSIGRMQLKTLQRILAENEKLNEEIRAKGFFEFI